MSSTQSLNGRTCQSLASVSSVSTRLNKYPEFTRSDIFVLTTDVFAGIANALDLTDRILPRLQARPQCRPLLLHFPPYSREELTAIVQDRLVQVNVVCVT